MYSHEQTNKLQEPMMIKLFEMFNNYSKFTEEYVLKNNYLIRNVPKLVLHTDISVFVIIYDKKVFSPHNQFCQCKYIRKFFYS